MLCAGRCGREATGHYDSGQPGLDLQHSWCDRCKADLAAKRMPVGLRSYGPYVPPSLPSSPRELSSADRAGVEHKIMDGAAVKSAATVAALPVTDTGTFSGYLAAFGEDLQGDSIMPGAMDESVAALNSGAITWNLTDSHSAKASDIVANVTAAAVDRHGLRIEGQWGPGERAQQLRQMVRGGQRIGLSIDYFTISSRPDGKGGRYLDRIAIVGGAVVVHPANPRALIFDGKSGSSASVVAWCGDRHIQVRRDPADLADDRMLAAADWPPRDWPRETRLAILNDVARAKAARLNDEDEAGTRRRARWEQANRYSSDMAAWLAEHR